jgi:hypothetical protein
VTDSDREPQTEPDEGSGWFGVPPGPIVNREETVATMARAAIRRQDMDEVERQMWEDWQKRQQREQASEADDAS